MAVDYRDRIARVLEAIRQDPAAPHSLDDMADLAGISRFHFARLFAAMTGTTPAEAVRRARLNAAAQALVKGGAPVAAVGRAVGYADAAAFARAFRGAFDLTPGAFRRRGQGVTLEALTLTAGLTMFPVSIRTEPPRRALGLIHTGPYPEIGTTFAQLGPQVAPLGPALRGMVAVYLSDPGRVAPAQLQSLAGVLVEGPCPIPAPLVEQVLPGGRHAVLTLRGPYSGLQAAYDWLFGAWLAASAEAPREAPVWEHYLNTPMDTAPDDLLTEIHLPLEGPDA